MIENLDENECAVICQDCNGYLHATVSQDGRDCLLVRCPYRCEHVPGVGLVMNNPPAEGEQRYGRS